MIGYALEIILCRQFAESISLPIFIIDTKGNLLFYNEPAESLLGLRYEDTGPMPVDVWSVKFKPTDARGRPLAAEKLPLVKTLETRKPATGTFWIESLSGPRHFLEVHSYPIIDRKDSYLGAMALFWQSEAE